MQEPSFSLAGEFVDFLLDTLPNLRGRIPRFPLGDWPTPVEPLHLKDTRGDLWVKREDISSLIYGGNKLRSIEIMTGLALERGADTLFATGALGSNHAVATALHAQRAGLNTGAILFPQPTSTTARANLEALLTTDAELHFPPTIALFPLAYARVALRKQTFVQQPGAAVPLGALGYIGAAVELAHQIHNNLLPEPSHILLAVGSTCTTAGLLAGTALAARLGLAWTRKRPRILAMRVTPWPVTAPWRIVRLAQRAAALFESLGGGVIDTHDMAQRLTVSGRYLGRGYGHPTRSGRDAIARFRASGAVKLDTSYSAKAAAGLLDACETLDGPLLFWASKSSPPLPRPSLDALRATPRRIRNWLGAPV